MLYYALLVCWVCMYACMYVCMYACMYVCDHALLRITSVLPYITIRYYTLLVTCSNREMTRRKGCCLVWDIYGTYDI